MTTPSLRALCGALFASALFGTLSACAPETSGPRGELRALTSEVREATITGSAGWSKWCGPLRQAERLAPQDMPKPSGAIPCPESLSRDALKALYPPTLWPTLKGAGERIEVLYERALSHARSTSMDPRCCYSVKHALAPMRSKTSR